MIIEIDYDFNNIYLVLVLKDYIIQEYIIQIHH